MALKQGKSEKFNEYLRALGNLKALHGAANDDELFKKLSFAERQALFALLDFNLSDLDNGDFSAKISKNDLEEFRERYESSKGADRGLYEKVSFDDAIAFFGFLSSVSPDDALFKKNVYQKIEQQPYKPTGTEFGAEIILEIGAGMVAGAVANMAIRAAFTSTAVALFGPTLAASIVVGAVAGAAVGTMFGTYYAYKNLPEKEKAKTLSEYPKAIIHAFEKNAFFIMKRAAFGGLLGAGSGLFSWIITGGLNAPAEAPSQHVTTATPEPAAIQTNSTAAATPIETPSNPPASNVTVTTVTYTIEVHTQAPSCSSVMPNHHAPSANVYIWGPNNSTLEIVQVGPVDSDCGNCGSCCDNFHGNKPGDGPYRPGRGIRFDNDGPINRAHFMGRRGPGRAFMMSIWS